MTLGTWLTLLLLWLCVAPLVYPRRDLDTPIATPAPPPLSPPGAIADADIDTLTHSVTTPTPAPAPKQRRARARDHARVIVMPAPTWPTSAPCVICGHLVRLDAALMGADGPYHERHISEGLGY